MKTYSMTFCKKCDSNPCCCRAVKSRKPQPYKTLSAGNVMKAGDEVFGWREILPTSVGKKVPKEFDGFVRRKRIVA